MSYNTEKSIEEKYRQRQNLHDNNKICDSGCRRCNGPIIFTKDYSTDGRDKFNVIRCFRCGDEMYPLSLKELIARHRETQNRVPALAA